jgi:hypothetical protein
MGTAPPIKPTAPSFELALFTAKGITKPGKQSLPKKVQKIASLFG